MSTNPFSIGLANTISGVLVEVKCSGADSFGGIVTFSKLILTQGGSAIGTDQSGAIQAPASLAYVSFGGSTNKLGAALTPAIVNSATFGVDVAFLDSGSGPGTASIDAVRLTVYYTSGGSVYAVSRGLLIGGSMRPLYSGLGLRFGGRL